MAVSQKDDTNKHKQDQMDSQPSNHQNKSVRSNNAGKNDGRLS